MSGNLLPSFRLVNSNKVISPVLVTIRSYADWFENTFDKYTSQTELYLCSKKTGQSLLERHPGTKIGNWFDKNEFQQANLNSWYILRDCPAIDRLVKLKMAEYKDTVPSQVYDKNNRQMLRLYTANQLELYIRQNLDKNFSISKYLSAPKQIKLRDVDMEKVIMPKVANNRRKFFN